MKIFGKTPVEYARFEKGLLILTVIVGLVRLALTLAGVPNSTATWFSLTAVSLFAVIYLPTRLAFTSFGTYTHLFVLLALQLLTAAIIITAGIAIAAVSGVSNIFQIDSPNANPIAHALQHLIGAPTIEALFLWAPASIVLFIARLATRREGAPDEALQVKR